MPTPSFHVGNEGMGPTVHPSLTDPKESIYLHWVCEENVTGLVYFPFGFYGEISLNLLHIVVARKTMGFTLFYARLMTCILRILFFSWFLSMVTMFYNFASFKQIWTTKYIRLVEVVIESDRGSRRKKINQLEKTIRGWEVKLSLGRLNQITGKGFTGSVTEGCDCMNCRGKLHTRGRGGDFCEMCYFREFFRLKRCIRGGSLYLSLIHIWRCRRRG